MKTDRAYRLFDLLDYVVCCSSGCVNKKLSHHLDKVIWGDDWVERSSSIG